ncbi:MAG: phosphatidylglycerophosphatase A [Kiritimatiellae bacterium]|nr:phosphatidylglycerophosphatase A [Kiritimatiellia bacterium]
MSALWKKAAVALAMGFGLGLSPVASGTVGSLIGVGLCFALAPLSWVWQSVCVAAMILAAIPVCDTAEKVFGKKDDGRVVADEYVTVPLCLIGIPWTSHLWLMCVAFLVHRALDIWKPAPARQMQNIPGGLGIVLDDVVSSLYGLGVMHAIWWAAQRYGLA